MADEKILKCRIVEEEQLNKIYIVTRSIPNDGYELYSYYRDELSFDENDFVGLRESEAQDLIKRRVLNYITG